MSDTIPAHRAAATVRKGGSRTIAQSAEVEATSSTAALSEPETPPVEAAPAKPSARGR